MQRTLKHKKQKRRATKAGVNSCTCTTLIFCYRLTAPNLVSPKVSFVAGQHLNNLFYLHNFFGNHINAIQCRQEIHTVSLICNIELKNIKYFRCNPC